MAKTTSKKKAKLMPFRERIFLSTIAGGAIFLIWFAFGGLIALFGYLTSKYPPNKLGGFM